MNPITRLIPVALLIGLLSGTTANAHRLSGLLQASLVETLPEQVGVEVTLFPGMDIASKVFSLLDGNNDGVVSEAEKAAWSEVFMSKQAVSVDGRKLPLTLRSIRTSAPDEMADGHGEIVVCFTAELGSLASGARTVVCANHYKPLPCAYQSNGLVPKAPGIRVTGHRRDQHQQELSLDVSFGKSTTDATETVKPVASAGRDGSGGAILRWASFSVAGLVLAAILGRPRRGQRHGRSTGVQGLPSA